MPRDKKIDDAFEKFKTTAEFASAQSFAVDPDPVNADAALYIIFEAGWNKAIVTAMAEGLQGKR